MVKKRLEFDTLDWISPAREMDRWQTDVMRVRVMQGGCRPNGRVSSELSQRTVHH